MDKIDFVVTWVDGSDPIWQKVKNQYSAEGADTRVTRYRDWDQLKYWFRAVEKYAPWVNKVHFVTFGHLPQWLNTDNPKLNIVRHEDFIPKEFLPVFNSCAIEVNLHRIPELSENFVYFCDDNYLMQSCKPTDFFKNGKPVDMATLSPIPRNFGGEFYFYHLYNNYSIYNNYFSKRVLLKKWSKFVNMKYGRIAITNLLNIACKNFFFQQRHLPMALQKSTFEILWNDYADVLTETAQARFRTYSNINLDLLRGYQLITGDFYPKKIKGIVVDTRKVDVVKETIESGKYCFLCLSDNTSENTFEIDKQRINASFDRVFPERSSFELAE